MTTATTNQTSSMLQTIMTASFIRFARRHKYDYAFSQKRMNYARQNSFRTRKDV